MPVNAMLLVNQLGRMPKQGTDGRECFYRHASSCKRCHGGTLKGLSKADSAMPRLRPAGRVVAQYQANAFESRKVRSTRPRTTDRAAVMCKTDRAVMCKTAQCTLGSVLDA